MNKDYTIFSADLSRVHPLVLATVALLLLSIFTDGLAQKLSIFLLMITIVIEGTLLWNA